MKQTFITISLFIAFSLLPIPLAAQRVTLESARQKAMSFFSGTADNTNARKSPRRTPKLTLASNYDEIFIFNDDANGGFVIISGDERSPDVLAYSHESRFDPDNIPCNKKAWLEQYARQVKYLWEHPEAEVKPRAIVEDEVMPLLGNTAWAQTFPFNTLCPEDNINGKPCKTGCVATAMAQIMYYHKWPQQTTKTIPGYTTETRGIVMPDIPVTEIDWDNMLDQYYSGYSQEQIDAVSTLMLLCGTSVEADYGSDETWASSNYAYDALLQYFDYELEQEYFQYHQDDWDEMIFNELRNGRPVYYHGYTYDFETGEGGGGHAFVVDGYKDGFIHVNWGWGYVDDEYYIPWYVNGYLIVGAFLPIQPVLPNSPREYAVVDDGKITFYYDTKIDSRSGDIIRGQRNCKGYEDVITECVIDSSFANYQHKKMQPFFKGCSKLTSIKGLEYLNVKSSSLKGMFEGCSSLTNIDFSHFDTSGVTDMSSMFEKCSSLESLDLSNFDTSSVTDMSYMFFACNSLDSLDLSNFDTSKVTNMLYMFNKCQSLKSLDLSNFDTSMVTDMQLMFANCESLESLDVSNFNTGNVWNMRMMFFENHRLKSLDTSNFNTSNVTDMYYMFAGCWRLDSLDLSSFDTSKVTDMRSMFSICQSVKTIYVSDGWHTPDVDVNDWTYGYGFFYMDYELVGGAGTSYWDIGVHGDETTWPSIAYAHVDGGPDNPGLLTYKPNNTEIHEMRDGRNAGIHLAGRVMTVEGASSGAIVTVYSLDGLVQAREKTDAKGHMQVNLNNLPEGVYIVSLSDGKSKKLHVK